MKTAEQESDMTHPKDILEQIEHEMVGDLRRRESEFFGGLDHDEVEKLKRLDQHPADILDKLNHDMVEDLKRPARMGGTNQRLGR